jgi:hypothetical protein
MSLFLKSLSASPLKDATPIALVKRADDRGESPFNPHRCTEHSSGILLLDTEANIGQELIELAPESGETFQLLPEKRKGQRDVIMIVGSSGSGKSTFAGNYMRTFQECYKTTAKNILVISADDFQDPAFAGCNHTHIKADMTLVEQPIELDELTRGSTPLTPDARKHSKDGEFKPSLVVFDDFEGISNKRVRDAVETLQQRILEIGRKRMIYCLFLCHRPANGRSTRYILNELTGFVMFPRFTSGQNLSYALKTHLNVPEGLRACFKNDKSWGRWIYIKNSGIQYILSPFRACIFDSDEVALALKKRSLIDKKRANIEADKALNAGSYDEDGNKVDRRFKPAPRKNPNRSLGKIINNSKEKNNRDDIEIENFSDEEEY